MPLYLVIAIIIVVLFVAWQVYYRFVFFFRDPERIVPLGNNIVAPADGTIIYIRKVEDGKVPIAIKNREEIPLEEIVKLPVDENTKKGFIIGIFMTLMDVHVNRAPISGRVERWSYFPGNNVSMGLMTYRKMFHAKPIYAGTSHIPQNERATTLIKGKFPVYVVQIADKHIKKIVDWVKEGEVLEKGQRIGIIRMGSQVDIVFPALEHLKIMVKEGDQVKAGETILATWEEARGEKNTMQQIIEEKTIEIRPARYSELAKIAQNNDGSNYTPDALAKILACAYGLAPRYILVAEIDGELAGHIIGIPRVGRLWLKLLTRGELFSAWKSTLSPPPLDYKVFYGAQIIHTYVNPRYRGRGIATMLDARLKNELHASGISRFWGWIGETNVANQKIAQRTGEVPSWRSHGWIRYPGTTGSGKMKRTLIINSRIPEEKQAAQEEIFVRTYDAMMRRLRDKGWLETSQILKSGIKQGLVLEMGPGPGYLGLEWLKKTVGTELKGLEISPKMIEVARRNAKEYGLEARVNYVEGDSGMLPFDDETFDAVFTTRSVHEWAQPENALNEIYRVLKPGGKYWISDLRRDMNPLLKQLAKTMTKPNETRPDLLASINAAYTREEIEKILGKSKLAGYNIRIVLFSIVVTGEKGPG